MDRLQSTPHWKPHDQMHDVLTQKGWLPRSSGDLEATFPRHRKNMTVYYVTVPLYFLIIDDSLETRSTRARVSCSEGAFREGWAVHVEAYSVHVAALRLAHWGYCLLRRYFSGVSRVVFHGWSMGAQRVCLKLGWMSSTSSLEGFNKRTTALYLIIIIPPIALSCSPFLLVHIMATTTSIPTEITQGWA